MHSNSFTGITLLVIVLRRFIIRIEYKQNNYNNYVVIIVTICAYYY